MHFHLGKIFISHTATDKPFVRALADYVTKEDFHVWLDERDLVAGDPLAEKISEGLSAARVVLVVVSAASVASKWLRYELNLVTDRMVNGQCRVIPIVIDDTPLPPEVRGLLYADCRKSLEDGFPSILTALQHESRRASLDAGFSARAEVLLKEVFSGTGWASTPGEYPNRDYDVIYLPIKDEDGDERMAFYDVVADYLKKKPPEHLSEGWWSDYIEATDEIQESLSLIVTQRPIGFGVDFHHPNSERALVRRVRHRGLDLLHRQVVIADFSDLDDEEQQKRLLRMARELLIECAAFEAEDIRQYREKHGVK